MIEGLSLEKHFFASNGNALHCTLRVLSEPASYHAMNNMSSKRTLLLVVVAAAGSLALLALLMTASEANATRYKGTEREFWVVNVGLPFNETKVGLPADAFSPSSITVKKGDTVHIHFFNTEDQEHHTFTIQSGPYGNINSDLAGGQNSTLTFVANQTGVFPYVCIYHMPTMQGQLIVEPPTIDEFRAQK